MFNSEHICILKAFATPKTCILTMDPMKKREVHMVECSDAHHW